ncbi:MAG: tryptophan synthase subunit alpha [Candidatus Firestonebacteria bacterium]
MSPGNSNNIKSKNLNNRIDEKFVKEKGVYKKNLIIYITAGYPNLYTTEKLIVELDKAGIDIIELGIPFSDPVADGPVIQQASQTALLNKVNIDKIFELTGKVRGKIRAAMVLMGYYNPILQYGIEKFLKSCKNQGIDGIIVPDLIPEESREILKLALKYGVKVIFLLAPTSDNSRIKLVASKSTGFIYCVSVAGITGERKQLPDLKKYIGNIRKYTKKPVALGFGVSNAGMAKKIFKLADAVIVGSAVIKKISDNIGNKRLLSAVAGFAAGLKKGMPHDRRN